MDGSTYEGECGTTHLGGGIEEGNSSLWVYISESSSGHGMNKKIFIVTWPKHANESDQGVTGKTCINSFLARAAGNFTASYSFLCCRGLHLPHCQITSINNQKYLPETSIF